MFCYHFRKIMSVLGKRKQKSFICDIISTGEEIMGRVGRNQRTRKTARSKSNTEITKNRTL